MLTPKQEKYAQNLVKGMSQRQAYKKAFNAKYKDEAIDTKAFLLFKKEDVKNRYIELLTIANEKSAKSTIMTAIERKEWLTKVLTGEIKEQTAVLKTDSESGESQLIEQEFPSKLDTKMKAMDILNKMDGEYIEKLKIGNEDPDKPFEVKIEVIK